MGSFCRNLSYLLTTIVTLLASALSTYAAQITGTVQSGPNPIASSVVTLYAGGVSSSNVLGTAQANTNGAFTISYNASADPTAVLYLIAERRSTGAGVLLGSGGGQSAIKFASVLGTGSVPAAVVVNERTTVASAYAMAQFISGNQIAGKSPGLQNAAATFRNLVDPSTGDVSSVLADPPNGSETSTMREFNSLANLLAACVDASGPVACRRLFSLTTPPRGAAPEIA